MAVSISMVLQKRISPVTERPVIRVTGAAASMTTIKKYPKRRIWKRLPGTWPKKFPVIPMTELIRITSITPEIIKKAVMFKTPGISPLCRSPVIKER